MKSRLACTVAGAATLLAALSACSSSGSESRASTGPSPTTGNSTGNSSPAGFRVNLDDCTDPSAVTNKVTGTWTIGYSLPLSGPVAGAVTTYIDGFKARIASANAAGEVDGVKISVVYKDDAFTPDRAKANVTEFLQKDHVDSLNTFGSGPTGAMADAQNAACVPLLYPSSSVAQYRDISQYPWTIQYLPSNEKEAAYDIKLVQEKFPNGATVGIAENQTASGKGYSDGFQAAAKGTNVKVVVVSPSTDPNAAATQIKAANPDMVYIAGIQGDCTAAPIALARVGFVPKLLLEPSNCNDQNAQTAAGQAADAAILPGWNKNPADPALSDDPGVEQYLGQVTTSDKDESLTVSGWIMGDMTVHTLKQAAAMPGGLTRENVIKAARNQDYSSPMFIKGISWVSTPTSMLGVSGFQTLAWDAATKAFKNDGAVISLK